MVQGARIKYRYIFNHAPSILPRKRRSISIVVSTCIHIPYKANKTQGLLVLIISQEAAGASLLVGSQPQR
jgi:hypothetical protein